MTQNVLRATFSRIIQALLHAGSGWSLVTAGVLSRYRSFEPTRLGTFATGQLVNRSSVFSSVTETLSQSDSGCPHFYKDVENRLHAELISLTSKDSLAL